jgi:DNA-binding response OmpR family regulator
MNPDSSLMLEGSRVLVVEDDHLIAWDLAESLTEHGAQVLGPSNSVTAAMQLLNDEHEPPPDVALLDLNLDGTESGYEVAKELQARGIPFVICSGYPASDTGPSAQDHINSALHCEKPIDGSVLSAVLRSALRTYRARHC